MAKIGVIISHAVILYLDELINQLYHKEYFGFIESADNYVDSIYDFIENDIHNFPKKTSPQKLSYLGTHFIFYNSNNRTTWFIFFEIKSNHYYISGILNNHCEEASEIKML